MTEETEKLTKRMRHERDRGGDGEEERMAVRHKGSGGDRQWKGKREVGRQSATKEAEERQKVVRVVDGVLGKWGGGGRVDDGVVGVLVMGGGGGGKGRRDRLCLYWGMSHKGWRDVCVVGGGGGGGLATRDGATSRRGGLWVTGGTESEWPCRVPSSAKWRDSDHW